MLSTSPFKTLKHAHTCTETCSSVMLECMYDGMTCTRVHYSREASTRVALAASPHISALGALGAQKWHDLYRP